jgi:hypothetical protein
MTFGSQGEWKMIAKGRASMLVALAALGIAVVPHI